jgi:hypothetical protein
MNPKEKVVFRFLLVLYAIIWAFCAWFFLTQMTGGNVGAEGIPDYFITPGMSNTEWFFALNIFLLLSLLGSGFLAYVLSNAFLKMYVKSSAKNRKVGLILFEDLTSGQLLRKMLTRCLILGFFMANIAYTLANQGIIIDAWRLDAPQGGIDIPDPEVMYHLLWLTAIPCVLFLIPIWLMINAGIVSTKKLRGADFETVNLTVSPLYKIVKGYAGIGFLYNYLIMLSFWALPNMTAGGEQMMGGIMQLISPLTIVLLMIPLVVLIELQQMKFRKKVEEILEKLDLNQEFINNIELKKR